jgi:putative flippase GtrA
MTTIASTRTSGVSRQFVRFAAVGVANTGLFLAVYLMFRTVVSAGPAALLATVLTTVTGTCASGKVAFGVDGPVGVRHHVKSMAVTGLGTVITSAAVSTFGAGAGELGELAVLVAASSVAGAVRFLLLRHWVFGAVEVVGDH